MQGPENVEVYGGWSDLLVSSAGYNMMLANLGCYE
jgi:hypothetical protein